MKFGKHIQAQTIPEWSTHYMSYKGLKKIIKELSAPLSPGVNPAEASKRRLQTVKAAFFFQVDRELEKVNLFYLRKEADAKVRLKSLIEKQKSLIARGPRNRISTIRALREAFIHSRHDLDKLQNFVEINGTGFRKILKKWDKRSKSSTKELYLARQVDVQPCFNQDVIAEFSDTVTKCLSELEHVLEEDTELMAPTAMPSQRDLVPSPAFRSALYPHILTPTQAQPQLQPELNVQEQEQGQGQGQQLQTDLLAPSSDATGKFPSFFRRTSATFLIDGGLASNIQIDRMEAELFYALLLDSTQIAKDMLATLVAHQTGVAKLCVTRVLWRACSELKDEAKRQLLLDTGMVDFQSADDINERTLAHEAAIHGSACILRAAVAAGVDGDKADYYGRRPMHYAAISGHAACIEYLLNQGCYSVTATDDDGDRAFDYAISNGHADCVRLLISHDRSIITEDVPDYPVLLLACEKGHDNIVTLLLEAGSEIVANSQGVHPAHVAARTGSVNILRLLLEHGAPVDVADKDLGWTPVFYAASEGNIGCIRILVDAGCDLGVTDENNRPPVYYAAYEGHLDSVDLLLEAASRNTAASRRADSEATDVASVLATVEEQEQIQLQMQTGGDGNDNMAELDLDGIPSLSLPPPLIPFRVYGHNFLGKRTQIQIRMMSRRGTDRQPVTFFDDCNMMSLKLVVMAKPDAGMVPHTVMLPLESTSTTFGFQTDDPTKFRLEFFLYPSFGLQPIGKAVALPSLFNSGSSSSSNSTSNSSGVARLPLLDRYLKLVAEVTFEFLVVRPFEGAQLQIGGKVETYWKSTNPGGPRHNCIGSATNATTIGVHQSPLAAATLRSPLSSAAIASPLSVADPVSAGYASVPFVVSSSLAAEHVCVQVQVCRDGVPVVSPRMYVNTGSPTGIKLSICSLTHAEFQEIMRLPSIKQPVRQHPRTDAVGFSDQGVCARPDRTTGTAAEWYRYVQDSGYTLKEVLELLPARLGVSIQVLYNLCVWSGANSANGDGDGDGGSIASLDSDQQDVNGHVDAILKVVYDDSLKSARRSKSGAGSGGGGGGSVLDRVASDLMLNESSQHNTIFCSYSPQVCIALNWKQPNYAVFLLTSGREPSAELKTAKNPGAGAIGSGDVWAEYAPSFMPPSHHLSLKEAVRFACNNNLLGVICNSSLLTRVPELIRSIKDNGLFLVSFGRDNYDEASCAKQMDHGVDAIMRAGVIRYEANDGIDYAI